MACTNNNDADIEIVVSDTDNAVDIIISESALIPISAEQNETLKHFIYNPETDKLEADRAIETTLNSLFLGEQHKMSSGAENIFFTNLGNETNFFPLWAGLKDQSLISNQGASGYIAPSARVYEDMFSLPLGGNTTLNSTGYSGPNYFGVNIAGLGITTTAGEDVETGVSLVYYLSINDKRVYKQILPTTEKIFSGDLIEWMFDHPVEIHAGTTIFAEIRKVDRDTDEDFGVFQVRQGDELQADGNYRYQAIVHNRLFVDKPVELISPYSKYKAMDFGLDSTGSTILLRDLSLGSDSLLVPHAVNTLEAIANGTEIKIKVKGGAKVIVESLPVSAISIDGSFVNSVLNQAVVQLNEVFTNISGFASDDTFVNSFTLSGNDLTLGINDGTSYTVDVTTLGVDENNFVASGSLSGSDLTLTMADATTVVIDASSLAVDTDTTISFGTIVGNNLELNTSDSSVITIDVTSLNVDTNLYVESGVLNGTDLDLTMSDSSVITIDAISLAIDNNTTVTGGTVNGTDIVLSLSDASVITIDASTLGGSGSSGNPVVSGSVVGTDLVLVLDDATQITIDATNMINGSSGLASNSGWNISYGANANDAVGTSTNDSTVNQQLPFYFGEALEQGSEFKWNFQSHGGSNLILGIWDGAESPISYNGGANTASNWGTSFTYAGGFTNGSNSTLLTTNSGSKYVMSNGGAMGIRFGNDGHLTLVDYSGTNEVAVAKTTIPLAVTSFNIQMYTWANGVLPNGIINNTTYIWDIVHDFANTEAGIINGILDHTVLKSAISIEKGEKLMFMLDEVGQGDYFGTNYTAASSGVATAEEQLDNEFKYETNEALSFEFGGTSDWNVNANATNYFNNGAGVVGYRKGGANTIQGMFSMRFNDDGKLTIYSEDNGEKIATAKSDPAVGSAVHFYYGVRGNRAYYSIPVISKQTMGAGSQPDANFVPTVADQTASVEEGDVLNFQIISSDNIVNQFVETDAPSWMSLDQNSGILSGTAPTYLGTSADTIVVNCKAGNAIGGTVDFTITVTVAQASYTNSKSLNLDQTSSFLQGNPVNMNAMDRASNGDGNSWSLSMWVKPNNNTSNQTLMVYGAGDDYNYGAITVKQSGGTSLVLNYGTVYDSIILVAANSFVANTWQHIMITFDGGYTGSIPADASVYYSEFKIYVDGVLKTPIGVASNGGYSGVISGSDPSNNIFRIGRANNIHNNYFGGIINQLAIWSSNQDANVSTIYNSGAVQDLSLLTTSPDHYYEIESSVTTIADIEGSADLTGYNFSNTDLVTDTP
tara:strand:- start:3646 stop:7491 length:3846 start_codon:yes stop_codon:yes gene_type:complete